MEIYNYHSEYNYFTGSSIADESPLEPGVFLIPAYATKVKPPEFTEGQIPVFDGTSWNVTEDKRGTYYNVISFESIENYNPLVAPENTTKEAPPEIPKGKILNWKDDWVLDDISPIPILTPEQKLQQAGLTIEDLKKLLGL